MNHLRSRFSALCICIALAAPCAVHAQRPARGNRPAVRDWSAVEQVLGRSGAAQPDGAYKFSFPRSDLHVTADGVAIKPGFALGSWLAFVPGMGASMMAMGDLVLQENELDAVLAALRTGGVRATAVHNHILHESPRIMYVHVQGTGDATRIAQTVRAALERTGTPLQQPAPPAPSTVDFDTAAVARALGYHGKVNGGVYQVAVPRAEVIRSGGMAVPASAGLATAINFQPTGPGKAAITGDFVIRPGEVTKVMDALQAGGIRTTALHSHMLDEEPRLFFMHFWANDNAVRLAETLHNALAQMNVKQPG